jgi:hypothetical protein
MAESGGSAELIRRGDRGLETSKKKISRYPLNTLSSPPQANTLPSRDSPT